MEVVKDHTPNRLWGDRTLYCGRMWNKWKVKAAGCWHLQWNAVAEMIRLGIPTWTGWLPVLWKVPISTSDSNQIWYRGGNASAYQHAVNKVAKARYSQWKQKSLTLDSRLPNLFKGLRGAHLWHQWMQLVLVNKSGFFAKSSFYCYPSGFSISVKLLTWQHGCRSECLQRCQRQAFFNNLVFFHHLVKWFSVAFGFQDRH